MNTDVIEHFVTEHSAAHVECQAGACVRHALQRMSALHDKSAAEWDATGKRLLAERDQLRADLAAKGEQLDSVCKQRDALMGKLDATEHDLAAAQALLNTPEIIYFAKAVQLEAAHQRSRWGSDHDAGKTDADWFWLIGYLGGKALRTDDGAEKQLHRIITVAAAACNWHAAKLGQTNMRPGIDTPKGEAP